MHCRNYYLFYGPKLQIKKDNNKKSQQTITLWQNKNLILYVLSLPSKFCVLTAFNFSSPQPTSPRPMLSIRILKQDQTQITDYTQITQCMHSKGGEDVIMSKLNTPIYIIKCAQNIGVTCSMCEQSLYKV